MLSGKIFFITGATGRLGVDLTSRLEELGASVVPVVLRGYPSRPKTLPWTARTQPISVTGPNDLKDLPAPDYAINLHWKVDRTRPFAEQIANEVRWNLTDFGFVWEWLGKRELLCFVNCSSIRVFSHLNKGEITSSTEPMPVSPYGIVKMMGEQFFTAFFEKGPTTVSHIRLCSTCSYGEHPSQLISRLMSSVFEGTRIQINTGHKVNLIYIKEAVDLLIQAALCRYPGRYLAVTPGKDVGEIAAMFERISGETLNAEFVDLEPGVPDPVFISDIDRLRDKWTRISPLEKAVAQILERRNSVESSQDRS